MAGISSQGITVGYGDGASPEVFTTIANVTGVDGPSKENPEIDVTDLSSTAKEFIPGLVDNGEITLNLNFDVSNTTHDAVLDDLDAGTSRNYKITFANVSPSIAWTFNAFPRSFPVTAGVDQAATGTLTLRINGAVTRP